MVQKPENRRKKGYKTVRGNDFRTSFSCFDDLATATSAKNDLRLMCVYRLFSQARHAATTTSRLWVPRTSSGRLRILLPCRICKGKLSCDKLTGYLGIPQSCDWCLLLRLQVPLVLYLRASGRPSVRSRSCTFPNKGRLLVVVFNTCKCSLEAWRYVASCCPVVSFPPLPRAMHSPRVRVVPHPCPPLLRSFLRSFLQIVPCRSYWRP